MIKDELILADLRHMVSGIDDQGSRPTCVPIATSRSHEAARGDHQALAPDALWAHANTFGATSAAGTSFSAMEHALGTWGQPPLTTWPYDPQRDLKAAIPGGAGAPPWHLAELTSLPARPESVLDALLHGYVPTVMLQVRDSFYLPNGGDELETFDPDEAFYGNHAVVVVAAAVRDDTTWFLIRNSWGSHWGTNGYAWLSAGYLESALVDAAVVESSTPAT